MAAWSTLLTNQTSRYTTLFPDWTPWIDLPAISCLAASHLRRARSLVDELLTVYTLEVHGLCKTAGVAMPSLVGQQDRVAAGRSR